VLLERVSVDGKTTALYDSRSPMSSSDGDKVLDTRRETGGLRLSPGNHRMEFKYTALSFTAPENMEFRYRLDGFDEDWNKGGAERVARYSGLSAGKYRFRVAACNNSGVWNETGATILFTVAPFIWQTWSFRIVTLALFTASVIAIVRYVSFRRLQQRL